MKWLWLDDYRDPVKLGLTGWTWAKTYEEAVEYLKTGEVEFASLDHDLGLLDACRACIAACEGLEAYHKLMETGCGHKEKTGYDLICWMEENNVWPRLGVEVHSANPSGREKMYRVIKKHYPILTLLVFLVCVVGQIQMAGSIGWDDIKALVISILVLLGIGKVFEVIHFKKW